MANVVEIILKATDKTGTTFSKLDSSFKSLTGFSLSAAGGIAMAGAAISKAVEYTKKAIDANDKYVSSIVDMARFTGDTTEEMSRLVQVADDMFLSQEALNNAMSIGAKKGLDMSVEGIKKLADQYNSLATVQEKNKLLNDNFGRSGLAMGKLLEQGSQGITKSMQAISDSLVVTKESVRIAYDYKKSLDAVSDAHDALAYSVAQGTMPAITKLNTRWSNLLETLDESGAVTKTITAGMWMLEGAIAGLDVIFGGWTTKLEHMIEVDASRWMAIYEQSLKDVGTQAGLTEEQIKALAEEQNKLAGNMISTTESMMSINDDYQKSLDEISKDETLTAQERITAIKKVEQEHEIATRKIILSMAQQILAQDGLTIDEANALLQQGVNWGIYSQTAVDEMMKVINEAGGLASAINSIPPSKEIKITTIYSSVGGGSSATVPVDIARLEREQNRDLNGNKIIGKASGGPVYANTPYIVGERGPELFVPGQSGGIVPNNKMGMNDSQLLDEIKSMNSMLSNLPYMMRDVMESIK